jgi:thiamine transporter ThiT
MVSNLTIPVSENTNTPSTAVLSFFTLYSNVVSVLSFVNLRVPRPKIVTLIAIAIFLMCFFYELSHLFCVL